MDLDGLRDLRHNLETHVDLDAGTEAVITTMELQAVALNMIHDLVAPLRTKDFRPDVLTVLSKIMDVIELASTPVARTGRMGGGAAKRH